MASRGGSEKYLAEWDVCSRGAFRIMPLWQTGFHSKDDCCLSVWKFSPAPFNLYSLNEGCFNALPDWKEMLTAALLPVYFIFSCV